MGKISEIYVSKILSRLSKNGVCLCCESGIIILDKIYFSFHNVSGSSGKISSFTPFCHLSERMCVMCLVYEFLVVAPQKCVLSRTWTEKLIIWIEDSCFWCMNGFFDLCSKRLATARIMILEMVFYVLCHKFLIWIFTLDI